MIDAIDKRVEASLLDLSKKIGYEFLALPITIVESTHPPAYTDASSIYISRKVYEEDSDNVKIYLLHEILHHVVATPDLYQGFSNIEINYAEDYVINWLMYDKFNYDVRKVLIPGLFNQRLGKKSVFQILSGEDLAKSTGCGCMGIVHPEIYKVAEAIKLRLNYNTRHPLWRTNIQSITKYVDMLADISQTRITHNVNYDHTYAASSILFGLIEHKSKASFEDAQTTLSPTQEIVYGLDYDAYKPIIRNDFTVAAFIVQTYYSNIADDERWLEDYTYRLKDRISDLLRKLTPAWRKAQILRLKAKGRRFDLAKFKIKLRKQQAKFKISLEKARRSYANRRKHDVSWYIRYQPTKLAVTYSGPPKLSSSSSIKENTSIEGIAASKTHRLLQSISRRKEHRVKQTIEALLDAEAIFGAIFPENTTSNVGNKKQDQGSNNARFSGIGKDKGTPTRIQALHRMMHDLKLTSILKFAKQFATKIQLESQVSGDVPPDLYLDLSNDVEKVTYSNWALYRNDYARLKFLTDLANHSAEVYSGTATSRGAVVVCVDGSGSMSGEPYLQAAGFALALLQKFEEADRGFAIITFCETVTSEYIAEKTANYGKALAVLLTPFFGGTAFDPPIQRAFDMRDSLRWEQLTIIFVTDGDGAVDKIETLKRKHPQDKIVSIIVGSHRRSLEPISDKIMYLAKGELSDGLIATSRML